ncbi:hypothetical protein M2202_006194 [Bradyrhizobium japonicum]|jgi:hypothetical protein|nr:hypothetical protein [Bradyrhizobium japonicum]MCP1883788.1 hypothetical protein [Bradyrhizobium japonicum]MCP1938523.1 hypothetical protein [Bradyrhizobium japonicum]MCP1951718.1 hypothetical protein [Bradyrhizobium japonicum]MCS3548267.1 hypothetical protein [Bradyrhizobium japonicum]
MSPNFCLNGGSGRERKWMAPVAKGGDGRDLTHPSPGSRQRNSALSHLRLDATTGCLVVGVGG